MQREVWVRARIPAVISVHDVMPETLSQVTAILSRALAPFPAENIALLVVPGRSWQPSQISQLRDWQAQGYELAGHGWTHEVAEIRGLYHRLHSWVLSRRAAEHLSYTSRELKRLLLNNYDWFGAQGMAAPELYVPPAWAVGALSLPDLRALPFAAMETTSGFRSLRTGRSTKLPLVGFEADNRWRAAVLRPWNHLNQSLCNYRRPLRLSIHPFDFSYLLQHDVQKLLAHTDAVNWRGLPCFESSRGHKSSLATTVNPSQDAQIQR